MQIGQTKCLTYFQHVQHTCMSTTYVQEGTCLVYSNLALNWLHHGTPWFTRTPLRYIYHKLEASGGRRGSLLLSLTYSACMPAVPCLPLTSILAPHPTSPFISHPLGCWKWQENHESLPTAFPPSPAAGLSCPNPPLVAEQATPLLWPPFLPARVFFSFPRPPMEAAMAIPGTQPNFNARPGDWEPCLLLSV